MKTLLTLTLLTLSGAVLLSACATEEQPEQSKPAGASSGSTGGGAKPGPEVAKASGKTNPETNQKVEPKKTSKELATFGAGCFWCVEAVLEQLDGVLDVTSGYMGGSVDNPTYRQICEGTTGHAEVVQVEFDPGKISYESLLKWFFKLHDPTTLNRQGGDVGTQYRSVVFYHSEEQKAAAQRAMKIITDAKVFADPLVTEVSAVQKYYLGESYHQDYYRQNKSVDYCRAVITPKLDKLGLEK